MVIIMDEIIGNGADERSRVAERLIMSSTSECSVREKFLVEFSAIPFFSLSSQARGSLICDQSS
jgi:hypothetical protein